jgi:predicted nucleic acid-binding protein
LKSILIDSSAFYALADRRDTNHAAARKALSAFAHARRDLLTTSYVIDETITLVRFRLGHASAVKMGERLMASSWCRTVEISDELRRSAWDIFVLHDDQSFSYTDCTSFAVMRAMGLTDAFTFDRRDFAAAGFAALPGR